MRPLEGTLVLLNLLLLFWCMSNRAVPTWVRTLPIFAIAILMAQVTIEGRRWQIYPAYFVTAWLFLTVTSNVLARPGVWFGLVGVGCLIASAVFCCVLPVFQFPAPTGPFPVGTVIRHLVDPSREETHGTPRGVPRELMVQIWYPAESRGPRRRFRSRSEVSLLKEHASLIRTNASEGVPVARNPGRFPVLIFSPSWNGRKDQNTTQVEELASHGYVVVGIDHPYGSSVTRFPDGRVIPSSLGEWMDYSSDDAQKETIRVDESELRIRAEDARFVLDTLERFDRSDPNGFFQGHFDTSSVGVFGHSFGGAVAAEVCRIDPRFRAGINMDGCLFGESAREGVEQRFLFMSSDGPAPTPSELENSIGTKRRYLAMIYQGDRDVERSLKKYGGYLVKIIGASHANFCDTPLFSPISRLSGAGPIEVQHAVVIINDLTLSFFDRHLNGHGIKQTLGRSRDFSEVELQSWEVSDKEQTATSEVRKSANISSEN